MTDRLLPGLAVGSPRVETVMPDERGAPVGHTAAAAGEVVA
jgi:hypothetical protein